MITTAMKYLLIGVMLMIVPDATAQGDIGVPEVRKVLDHLRNEVDEGSNGVIWSEIQLTSVPVGKDATPIKEVMRLNSGNDRNVVDNEQYSLFQDATTRVMILHRAHEVLISDQIGDAQHCSLDLCNSYNDHFLTIGKASYYRRTKTQEGEQVELTLDLPATETNGIAQLTYVVDATHYRLISVRAHYRPGHPYRDQELRYTVFQPGRLDPRLKRTALAQVLRDGKYVTLYSNYRISDIRQSKLSNAD